MKRTSILFGLFIWVTSITLAQNAPGTLTNFSGMKAETYFSANGRFGVASGTSVPIPNTGWTVSVFSTGKVMVKTVTGNLSAKGGNDIALDCGRFFFSGTDNQQSVSEVRLKTTNGSAFKLKSISVASNNLASASPSYMVSMNAYKNGVLIPNSKVTAPVQQVNNTYQLMVPANATYDNIDEIRFSTAVTSGVVGGIFLDEISIGSASCMPANTVFTPPNINCSTTSFFWPEKNKTYYASNTTDTIKRKTTLGCDSIVTLNFTMMFTPGKSINQSSCGSYTWNGQTYASSGKYTFNTARNSSGCWIVDTLNLTISQKSSSITNTIICSSQLPYTWNSLVFTSAGSQTKKLVSYKGCDSMATLNLSVTKPFIYNTVSQVNIGAPILLSTSLDVTQAVWKSSNAAPVTATNFNLQADTIGTTVAGGNGMGTNANQLGAPTALFLDFADNLYVTDGNNGRVQKFSPGSTSASNGITVAGSAAGTSGVLANQLSFPYGVFLDDTSNLYVADRDNNRVQKFPSGSSAGSNGITVAGVSGTSGKSADKLHRPSGVFVDGGGNLFILDQFNSRIQKFAPGATQATTFAGIDGAGSLLNQFAYPGGFFVDALGNVWVADADNDRVVQYFANNVLGSNPIIVAGTGAGGSALTQIDNPTGVFKDKYDNLYVSDGNNNRILRYSSGSTSGTAGVVVAGGNGEGTSAKQLATPNDLIVDRYGNVYIADMYNNRVQKWKQMKINQYSPSTGGNLKAIVTNTNGCTDSLTFTINAATQSTKSVKSCGPYTWNGTSYTSSGSYAKTFKGANQYGADSTANLILTVVSPVTITAQPTASPLTIGNTVTLSVNAGQPGLQYQWKVRTGDVIQNVTNGGQFSGSTSNSLQISAVQYNQLGQKYFVQVATDNACPSVTSDTASLQIINPNCVQALPVVQDVAAISHNSTTLSVDKPSCTGSNSVKEQWYSFSAKSSTVNIKATGTSGFDPIIQAYSGTCSTLKNLGCWDGNHDTTHTEILTLNGLTVGNQYYFRVYNSATYNDGTNASVEVKKP